MTETLEAATGAESIRWDLSELYPSGDDAELSRTLADALEFVRSFEARYKGQIRALRPEEFAEMMVSLETHYIAASKPGLYAHLLHTIDTRDHRAGRLVSKVREAGAQQGRHMVFFGLEVAELSDEEAEQLYSDPATAKYRHTIEQERRYRKHQLSEPEERVLTDFSPVASPAWSRLFEELCAAVKVELDSGGVPLPIALSRLREGDRSVREEASHATTRALRADLRTRAYIFNTLLQEKAISDRVRGYERWISARNLANEISDGAVQALVEAVTGRYEIVSRYYRVKRRLLGLDELHEWDRYAPLEVATRRVDWDSAKEMVLSSYRRFSPRAGQLVEDFFGQGWIDAPVVEGKEGGAYCAFATPNVHPFVMLNFTGRLNDALTLAHELGHGLHDRLAAERNHLFDYHPPLTLAETASVFGETLTFDAIMSQESDPKVKLSLLCHQVEDSFATVFRQIAMNRFEDAAHTARRSEGELAPEQIGVIWQEKMQAMFGDSVTLTDEHRDWWSYVEHFVHTPGYVYAYAFGNLLALSIYRRYRELEDPAFVESYLSFLGTGGSMSPEVAVRGVGLDIADPAFWDRGLDIVDGMVMEVERLAAAGPAGGGSEPGA